jgi:hypothetical protein
MNLYSFHSNPERLLHHDTAIESVPKIVWERYSRTPTKLKRYESVLAKSAEHAYKYAHMRAEPFPAGEAAIAKSARWSYTYAVDVLMSPFPAGEAAIAADTFRANRYAQEVLKAPFPAGEAAIGKDARSSYYYAQRILKGPFPSR